MTQADEMSHADDQSRGTAGSEPAVIRSEEELSLSTEPVEVGRVRLRKHIVTEHDVRDEERTVEDARTERAPASDGDTGEVITYDDGSVSIPVFAEELVVSKRVVVVERLVVHKESRTVTQRVEADLSRESVEIDADPDVADRVTGPNGQ